MFQSKGSSSDDRPYEIRMEDIELKESMVVASTPQTREPSIKNFTDKVVEMTRRYFLNRGNASTRISDRRPLKEIPLSPR